ncbi:hypothetical protein PARHAE_01097 [Paracoccus haematequi]|uniref:DUF927 domain-containing protein n=1 Tax=Paracoccus haematequi TaxID=2491866 RepID=A0A447IK81_9RHOB|nr:hypothetical protein [Paracoccus haematequi]VDS07917.1 hypothetical protein PARHAE_01097 [Paracoccus haematequi]
MADPIHDLGQQLAHAPVAAEAHAAPETAAQPPQDGPPPPDAGDPGPQPGEIWPDCPVRALGVNGDLYFYLDRLGQMRIVKKHEGQTMMSLFQDRIELLCRHYPAYARGDGQTIIQGKFNQMQASTAMMTACAERGLFNPDGTVRGVGAWKDDDGRLIYHCGKVLLTAEGERPPDDIDGKIYPAYPPIPAPAPPDSKGDPAPDIIAMLSTWSWQRPDSDPMLSLGMICVLILCGALDWRPAYWLTGDKASGKSTFQDFIAWLLGGDKGMVKSTDATKSGITSRLGHSSLPVLLDELEPGDEGSSKERDIILLARVASSGGQWVRGSADQKGASGNVYSAFLFSSILIPGSMGPQDRSRLIILNLDTLPADAPKPAMDARTWRARGARLKRILIDRWPTWEERLSLWRVALAEAGLGGRNGDNYATTLAMADMALSEALPTPDTLQGWAAKIAKAARRDTDEIGSDAEDMIQHLLGQPYDVYRRGEMFTVAHWIMAAAALPSAPRELIRTGDSGLTEIDDQERRDAAKRANEKLAKAGLRVKGAGDTAELFIANKPLPGLCKLFEHSRWANGVWSQSSRRVPEAHPVEQPLTLAGQRVRGVYIPLRSIGGLLAFPMDRAPVVHAPMGDMPSTPKDFEDYI